MRVSVSESEVELKAVRSGGPGGQHANKTSTAIQLRFDSQASSLPTEVKARLLKLSDDRISDSGVIIITAREFRSQSANKDIALQRLEEIINRASYRPRSRKATQPTRSSVRKRLRLKREHSLKKKWRKQVKSQDDGE